MAIETFVGRAKIQELPKTENELPKIALHPHKRNAESTISQFQENNQDGGRSIAGLSMHSTSFQKNAMKWNNRSLFAYSIYRFVLDTGHAVDRGAISSHEADPSAQIGTLKGKNTKEDLLDKLWALIASQNQLFFVQFDDGTKNVVHATELTEFLLANLHRRPKQWPTNFLGPKECDDWLELSYRRFQKQIETS